MMKIRKTITLLFGTGMLLLASCSSSDSPSDDEHLVRMPVNLAIPANDASLTAGAAGAKATRAEGDPGTYEKFQLPSHLYIYLINTSISGTSSKVLTPEGMDLNNGYTLDPKKWTKTTTQDNNKDSIYTYTDQIRIIIPEDRSTGVVYAAMSSVPITVKYTGTDLADATFTLRDAAKDKGEALKNLYSSPYNNMVNGSYYGTVSDYKSNSPYINMVLYHVASKLDLQWNVDASVQDKVKLSKIQLTGLSSGGYLFKPLENTSASNPTYTETFTLDAGSQWYGRAYRYVIPVADSDGKYTFTMTLSNGSSANSKSKSIVAGTINQNQPFTPWMLGTINVTSW